MNITMLILIMTSAFMIETTVTIMNVKGNAISARIINSGGQALIWVLSSQIYCSPQAELIKGFGTIEAQNQSIKYKNKYILFADFVYIDAYPQAGESTGDYYPMLTDKNYLIDIWKQFLSHHQKYVSIPTFILTTKYGAISASLLSASNLFKGMILFDPLIYPNYQAAYELRTLHYSGIIEYREYLMAKAAYSLGTVSCSLSKSNPMLSKLINSIKDISNITIISPSNCLDKVNIVNKDIWKSPSFKWNECSSHYKMDDLYCVNALNEFNSSFHNNFPILVLDYGIGIRKLMDLLIYRFNSDVHFEEIAYLIDGKRVGSMFTIKNLTFVNTNVDWSDVASKWIKDKMNYV